MLLEDSMICPCCSGKLHYYDTVKRKVITAYRKIDILYVERRHCEKCGKYHRIFCNRIVPYKRYDRNVILDILNGAKDDMKYEDYPCDATIQNWISVKNKLLYE